MYNIISKFIIRTKKQCSIKSYLYHVNNGRYQNDWYNLYFVKNGIEMLLKRLQKEDLENTVVTFNTDSY